MANVIFIPGIMGSILKMNDATKWPALLPGAVRELNLENIPQILDPAPLLKYGRNFYSIINNHFLEAHGSSYDFFPYDWRHNLLTEDTFQRLLEFIRGKNDVTLVAHSMGGLLTYLFIQWCYENNHHEVSNITKVVTIATPWRGSPDALWRLYYGEPHPYPLLPLSSAAVMKEVTSSFPSVYQLLPHAEAGTQNGLVFDPNLDRYLLPLEIYDRLFSADQLEKYKTFCNGFQSLINMPWPDGIETYAVIGQGYGTAKTIVIPVTDEEGSFYEKEKIIMGSGDLTVPVVYALPYDSETKCRFIKATHTGIVINEHVLSWISSIINNEADNFEDNFELEPTEKFSGRVIKVACPVKVSIYKDGDQLIAGEATDLEELKRQIEYISSLEELETDNDPLLVEEMKVFGETTYVITEQQHDFDYKIEGKEEGLASVEVVKYSEGNITEINVFPSIQVKEGHVSTLHITSLDEISLTMHDKHVLVMPKKIRAEESRKKAKPVTYITYELQHGSKIISGEDVIIQSPVKFNFTVEGISDDEYLETRILVNQKKFITRAREYVLNPIPGPNEVIIYSVSKYGNIDEKPKKFNFIYDREAPVTTFTSIMFHDRIQMFFRAEDDSKGKVKTQFRFFGEEQWRDYTYAGIPLQYNGTVLEYRSVDIVGNEEKPKYLTLPNEQFHQNAFITRFERYEQVINALHLNDEAITSITRNGNQVQSNDKIRKSANNITVSMLDGRIFSLVFNQEIDVLWTIHPTEILSVEDKELLPFRFRLVAENGFVQLENVKVKLVPKGKKRTPSLIEISFIQDTMEYQGLFGTPIVPRSFQEGKVQVLVNNKMNREAKFKIM